VEQVQQETTLMYGEVVKEIEAVMVLIQAVDLQDYLQVQVHHKEMQF
jgi:hypothetical protein